MPEQRHDLLCNHTGLTYDPTKEQYSRYPKAIADEQGYPLKGSKAAWKEKIMKRYQSASTQQVVSNNLPDQWMPDVVILDGTVFYQLQPLQSTETIATLISCSNGFYCRTIKLGSVNCTL